MLNFKESFSVLKYRTMSIKHLKYSFLNETVSQTEGTFTFANDFKVSGIQYVNRCEGRNRKIHLLKDDQER